MQSSENVATSAASSVALEEIIISSELTSRPTRQPDIAAENAGMQSLAALVAEGSLPVFRKLLTLAVQFCGADSAGVSVLETRVLGGAVFRWTALAGLVQPFEGGETPRNWSPCGTCLDRGQAMLYSYPERHFTYLQALGVPIVEGLVLPMHGHGANGSTIWILSHEPSRRFDAEDVRVMMSLGRFAAQALALSPAEGLWKPAPETTRETVWRNYVAQVARGDHASLTALFNETGPLVFATILRIVGFSADADEVTTDVYARIWNVAASYNQERGSVASWLRTIARSMAFDRLRTSSLRAGREVRLGADYRDTTDIEDELIAGQARKRVMTALRALPDEQRRAIELSYLSGLTSPEIASITGDPVGTIKTRLRLGLIKLRRLLASDQSVRDVSR